MVEPLVKIVTVEMTSMIEEMINMTDEKLDYPKLTPDDGVVYRMVEKHKSLGNFICDSRDHNEPSGCSNPECFKYKEKK